MCFNCVSLFDNMYPIEVSPGYIKLLEYVLSLMDYLCDS